MNGTLEKKTIKDSPALQGTDCFWASCWPFPATPLPLIHRCHPAISSSKRVGLEDQLDPLLQTKVVDNKVDKVEQRVHHMDLEEEMDILEIASNNLRICPAL